MKPIMHTALSGLAALLVLTGAASANPSAGEQRTAPRLTSTDSEPVELVAAPGSEADTLARRLMAREIERARADGHNPLVLVAMGRLNDAEELLFVQIQAPGECGSAGCSTVSFKYAGGRWIRVVDTVSGNVRIATTQHRGMPDLVVDGSRLVWDGAKYREVG